MTYALMEQWKQPLVAGYVRNNPALQDLLVALGEGDSIVELVGMQGTGKTTLVKSLIHERPELFDGVLEYFIGSPSAPLTSAIDVIAESFRRSRGRNLLVIDGGERMDRGDLLEGINRLSTGPWRFATVVTTTLPLNIGRSVLIGPLSYDDMAVLLQAELGRSLPPNILEKLWAASQGVPRLARILADRWNAGGVRSLDALADLLNPFAVPGLVDAYGRPLSRGGHEEKTIISDVRFVSEALLKTVGQDPNLVHALTSREFEELSA